MKNLLKILEDVLFYTLLISLSIALIYWWIDFIKYFPEIIIL